MTNYNERLDELLLTYKSAHQIAFNEIDPHGNNMSPYDGSKAVSERSRDIEAEAKQAITSLIKELVAEAKPKIDLLDIGVLTGGTIAVDKLGRKNIHAPKDEQKFADSSTIESHQAAYMVAYKLSSDIFEQNLLKALERV